MATAGWRTNTSVGEALRAQPDSFEFFQAIRLLCHAVGEGGRGSEPLPFAFRSAVGQAFPSREIQLVDFDTAVEGSADVDNVVIHVARLGLFGPRSPLPTAHTEWVYNEHLAACRGAEDRSGHQRRAALPAFLDLFSRRLISLEYRTKETSSVALESRRPPQSRLGERLFCLIGLRQCVRDYPVPQGAILAVSGLLANRRSSKVRLQKVLRLWLDLPIEVYDHIGGWRKVATDHHTVLGRSRLVEGQVVGERVWLQQGFVGLVLRGISYETLLDYLLQTNGGRPPARDTLRAAVGLLTEFRWPIRLTLTTPWSGVPRSRLYRRWRPRTADAGAGQGGRVGTNPCMLLGRTSWLKGRLTDEANPATGQRQVSTTMELDNL